MKPAEIRQLSDEQVGLQLKETMKNLFHLRFQSATDRLETPSELKKAKADVARIKTLQRESQLVRELAAGLPEEGKARIEALPPQYRLAAARTAAARAAKATPATKEK
jgi:large subunit ribosomal protein L29